MSDYSKVETLDLRVRFRFSRLIDPELFQVLTNLSESERSGLLHAMITRSALGIAMPLNGQERLPVPSPVWMGASSVTREKPTEPHLQVVVESSSRPASTEPEVRISKSNSMVAPQPARPGELDGDNALGNEEVNETVLTPPVAPRGEADQAVAKGLPPEAVTSGLSLRASRLLLKFLSRRHGKGKGLSQGKA